MKRVKFFLLIALIGWGMSSCKDSTDLSAPDLSLDQGMDDLVGTDAFYSITDQLASPEISTPTESTSMEVVNDGFPEDPAIWSQSEDDQSFGKQRHCDLNLNEEQRAQMMEARKSFVDCIKPNLKDIRSVVKDILQEANVQRKALLEQFKNDEISKEELKDALGQLKDAVKTSIRENDVVQTGVQAIKECHAAFVDAAQEILSEEQFAQWQECKKKAKRYIKHKRNKRGKHGG